MDEKRPVCRSPGVKQDVDRWRENGGMVLSPVCNPNRLGYLYEQIQTHYQGLPDILSAFIVIYMQYILIIMKSSQIKATFYLLPLVIMLSLHAQSTLPRFEHLSVEQGLSHHSVTCMVKDDQGFLWFGTEAGLNRYDGHSFKVFRNDPPNPSSISNDNIYQIIKPSDPADQVLWIGTRFGLNKLNLRTEQFTSYIDESGESDKPAKNVIGGNIIFDLAEDSSGNIWLGTADGLKMLNPETEKITQVTVDQVIRQVCVDRRGYIWIGSTLQETTSIRRYDPSDYSYEEVQHPFQRYPGENKRINFIYCSPNETQDILWYDASKRWLVHYNTVEKTHIMYDYVDDFEGSVNSGWINSIVEDSRGFMWLGTRSDLNRFDRETGKFKRFYMKSGDKSIWDSNFVNCLFLDDSDMLWICTHDGIYRLNLHPSLFTNYQHQVGEKNSLNSNVVLAIYTDSSRTLSVGTTRAMNVIDRENNSIGLLGNIKVVADIEIYDIYYGADGYLYGANSRGLSRYDSTKAGSFPFKAYDNYSIINYADHPEVSGVPIGKPVYDIEVDVDRQIWLGTQGGLDHFDRGTELFTHYFPGDKINMLLNPKLRFSNELLLGTDLYGIIRFDRIQRQVISIHSNNPHDPGSLSDDRVHDIYENSKGDIWVATQSGLNLMQRHLNPDSTTFITYTQADGLPSNIVQSIEEDTRGNLWLGTGYGLSKFDPETKSFKNYYSRDGLPGNTFVANSSFRGPDGELLFGTTEGLTTFFPDSIPDSISGNSHIPPIVLTDFKYLINQSPSIHFQGIAHQKVSLFPKRYPSLK
ncbi:MAG: hypothetical protein H8E14_09155 [Candidatus Marinimicrobia bacterium]|nr:hypothetical protein [Candidatus Neomarinimicrobiota bacterium]